MGGGKITFALLLGLVAAISVMVLVSTSSAQAAMLTANSTPGSVLDSFRGHGPSTVVWPQDAGDGAADCTIAIATGSSITDGRPVLWKNRDYFDRSEAWQAILFWHQATGNTFSISDTFEDRFNYVAVSDRGDRSDPQDVAETLYYPHMGANERGLAIVSAQAHTLGADVQTQTVDLVSQDQRGIRNGGLNHWILSRCETITDVERLLTDTNDGGGYNGSTARNTASLIAVIDRFGGAAIFEVDGNSFARQNITKEFTSLDERPHSSGPPAGGYNGFDYRSNFSRITFTNTKICSDTICFPYFPDENQDGINDLEYSESSKERWKRVEERMDDALKMDKGSIDYRYFIQRWVRAYGHPRENYLETLARSVGYAPYLSSPAYAWTQEKSVGNHLNRFVTVSSVVIVGSKAGDQDEGKLTTMWVALGEPSVAIFVPVFPYAGQPPAVLDDFFLSINAKRRLVYDYERDIRGYPIDNIDPISPYTRLRNYDHSIDLSALFGGNYYGEGGLQAYNFAIEEELYTAYQSQMDKWRELTADQITPGMLADWQATRISSAVEEYVKSDPTIVVWKVNRVFTEDRYISRTHDFAGPAIVEVIAKGEPDNGTWPRTKVWLSDTNGYTTCLTEVGDETGIDCTVVVSPAHATNKAKSVNGDLDGVTATMRFDLYRYRTNYTGTADLYVEVVSATAATTVTIDKVLLRTEPRSVEMYEVEKDWDARSEACVQIDDDSILITDTTGHFDIHHYAWGEPLTIEVVAKGFSINPSPVLKLYCNSQLVGTATLTMEYAVYAFGWSPGSEGQITCRIQPDNYKDIRVDKLLMKEGLPVYANTAPSGCFSVEYARVAPIGYIPITATARVTDPDGDAIASYFWDFGDGQSSCSGNPVVTHTYRYPNNPARLVLYATDHRGKTAVIRCCYVYLPIVMRNYPP